MILRLKVAFYALLGRPVIANLDIEGPIHLLGAFNGQPDRAIIVNNRLTLPPGRHVLTETARIPSGITLTGGTANGGDAADGRHQEARWRQGGPRS